MSFFIHDITVAADVRAYVQVIDAFLFLHGLKDDCHAVAGNFVGRKVQNDERFAVLNDFH